MLKAENISYESNGKKLIELIDAEFKPGILYGIVGPNGAGKSTFLKTLSGIWPPTNGQVLWNNEKIHLKDRKEISQILSLVPQQIHVLFDFFVEEIVAMGRYTHDTEDRDVIEKVMKTVDIWQLRKRHINEISHGERQRVYIARALCTESPVLLLDEPTSSLDIRHQLEIWELMKSLLAHDKIIVTTTHDLSAARQFCDIILVLDQGKCRASGQYQSIMTENLLQEVFGVADNQIETTKNFSIKKRQMPHQ